MNKNLTLILFCFFLFFATVGISAVIFPVILHNNGVSKVLIGFGTFIHLLSGALIAPYINKLSYKIKPQYIISFFVMLFGVIILIAPFYLNYYFWSFLMILEGISFFACISLKHGILQMTLNYKNRSLYIGVVSTTICVALALGSSLVKFISGAEYIINIIAFLLCLTMFIVLMFFIDTNNRHLKKKFNKSILNFIKKKPEIFLAKFTQEYISVSIITLIVIYGINNGYSAKESALFVSFYTISGLIDIFVAKISKKIGTIKIINISIFCIFIIILLVYVATSNYILFCSILFVLGCFIGAIYVPVSMHLNSSVSTTELILVSNSLNLVTCVAGSFASLLTAYIFQLLGNIGFFLPMLVVIILYYLFIIYYKYKKSINL